MNTTRSHTGSLRPMLATCMTDRDDGDLLARFAADGDEVAFAALVRNLGPMVLGTCRRFLGAGPDADDAFQATFIVLARRAATVQPPGRVAGWIYGVACLTARKARATRNRRQLSEVLMATVPDTPASVTASDPDLGSVLDEELACLPDKYRLPIVLCELREQTIEQAAAQLGLRPGTVASRLSRGRRLLADRLARRGLAGGLLAVFASGSVRAAVPARLISDTIRVAGEGSTATGPALSLSAEVLGIMGESKFSIVTAGLVMAAVALGAIVTPDFPFTPRMVAAPVPATPVPATPAQASGPLDRMKLDGLNRLLQADVVQKALQLSDEQLKKIDSTRADTGAAPLPKPPQPAQGLPGGLRAVGNISLHNPVAERAFDKAAIDVLTPAQAHRLKQIVLQARGPEVFLDRHVIRALGLTAEQEDRIEAAIPPAPASRPGAPAPAPDLEANAKSLEVIRRALTADQWSRWEKLIGKSVSPEELTQVPKPVFPGAIVITGATLPGPGGGMPAPGQQPQNPK